jgi:hypothetical protein
VQAIVKKAKAEIIPPVIKKSSTPATTKPTDAERVETICRRIRDLRVRHLVVRAIKWLIKEYHISTGELE